MVSAITTAISATITGVLVGYQVTRHPSARPNFSMKKLLRILFLGLLPLVLLSCSSKQSSTPEDRLKWNQKTLAGDYDLYGQKDSRWDGPVKESLADYAKIRSGSDFDQETRLYLIGAAAGNAVGSGCQDPLVQFLYCTFGLTESGKSLAEKQELYRKMGRAMENSSYSPLRKFYASLGAATTLWEQRNNNNWPDVRQFRANSVSELSAAFQDRTLPVEELYHATHALFQTMVHNQHELTNAYNAIEAPLFQNWPKAGAAWLIKADFYEEYAWMARGHGTASQVSDQQWNLFHTRVAEAEKALNQAWSLNHREPLIPTLMLSVVTGEEKKRPEIETWFDRAMNLDTNNYAACRAKLNYLLPEWYGSVEDVLAFGRECVSSPKWGGHVPLILVDVHSTLARSVTDAADHRAYWKTPGVWTDIQSAYEKFAKLNPNETRFRYPYAAYALRCGQPDDFLQQIQLIRDSGTDFNYRYFGGKETFDQLMQTLKPAAVGK